MESEGPGHAGFFVDGEEGFQGRVRNVAAFQHRQNARHADAVVRPQRGAFCTHPIAVHKHPNALGHEVEFCGFVLLTNHVHVALEHHGFPGRHTGGCRLLDQHVAHFVLKRFKPFGRGPFVKPFNHLALVLGRARNGVQIGESIPQVRGLELAHGMVGVVGVVCHASKGRVRMVSERRVGCGKVGVWPGAEACGTTVL